jgi:hypothetical protein
MRERGIGQPVEVRVHRLHGLKDPGCTRLKVSFDQRQVMLPNETMPRDRHAEFALNWCEGWTATRVPGRCAARESGKPAMKTAWRHLGLAGLLWLLALAAWADDGDGPGHWWERSIWGDPERTYQWYPPDPQPPAPQPATAKPKPLDIRAMNSVRAIREELDRLKDVAVMTPTPENVRRFLDAQQFVMEKGAVFADVARRVVWASPDLDYSLRRPTHNAAIQTWKVQQPGRRGGSGGGGHAQPWALLLPARRLSLLPPAGTGAQVPGIRLWGGGLPDQP